MLRVDGFGPELDPLRVLTESPNDTVEQHHLLRGRYENRFWDLLFVFGFAVLVRIFTFYATSKQREWAISRSLS